MRPESPRYPDSCRALGGDADPDRLRHRDPPYQLFGRRGLVRTRRVSVDRWVVRRAGR